MSEQNDLPLNTVMYQVLKPGTLRDQAGNMQYAVVGVHPTLAMATMQSASIIGALIAVMVIMHRNEGPVKPAIVNPVKKQ